MPLNKVIFQNQSYYLGYLASLWPIVEQKLISLLTFNHWLRTHLNTQHSITGHYWFITPELSSFSQVSLSCRWKPADASRDPPEPMAGRVSGPSRSGAVQQPRSPSLRRHSSHRHQTVAKQDVREMVLWIHGKSFDIEKLFLFFSPVSPREEGGRRKGALHGCDSNRFHLVHSSMEDTYLSR